MRAVSSRLRELVESTEYRKDFSDLKKSILELKSPNKGNGFIFKEEGRSFWCSFTGVDCTKSIKTRIIHRTFIPLKRVQALLKNGNINEHWVEIPSVYEDFTAKYELNFLFDPTQPYQLRLDPFVSPLIWSFGSDTVGTKITMTVDISYRSKVLESLFKVTIQSLKKMWNLKAGRKERYLDDETYRVKKLLQEGFNGIQIFKTMNPEHKKFNPRNDYFFLPEDEVIDGEKVSYKTGENKDGWKKYIRTLRLIQRVKKGNLIYS